MTDVGEVHHFLGIQISQDRKNRQISLGQGHFAKEILAQFGMSECKSVATPLDSSIKLTRTPNNQSPAEGGVDAENPANTKNPAKNAVIDNKVDQTFFRQIVGSLMYLMIGTRPDLAAVVGIISQFAAEPRQ